MDNSVPLIKLISSGNVTLPDFAWLNSVPLVGDKLYSAWHGLLDMGGSAIMAKVRPYIGTTTSWFVGQAAHRQAAGLLRFDAAVQRAALLARRAGGLRFPLLRHAPRGQTRRRRGAAAGQAVRAVALGVVTALTQAVLGGIGLAVSGVPYAALLTVVMIFTCLVQLGPLLVLVPSIIWLYWSGDTTWGTVLLVWSCVVGTMDNVIRPVLIRMGADLPMILILTGVIGGLIAFGMIGLFIGPVLLAVSWRLYDAWVHEVPPPPKDPDVVLKSSVSWRPVASNAWQAGRPACFFARILLRKFIDRRQCAGPARPSLSRSPGPSQQFNY
ncbi:AI-2E family transporter YdiK [Klebsiella pneumoniae subsp. pneumoniae]|nr:AI-2E family transporter YdiK [Klebsiella pneumoniae subsp. pneumoniae]